jgi:hypothetical protein
MKRATSFPLGLIGLAILAAMAATYWLTDRAQNAQRQTVLRNQSVSTTDQFTNTLRSAQQELLWWGAVYLQTIETARELRPDLKAQDLQYYSAVAQASVAPPHYDLVMVVDAERRIRTVAASDAGTSTKARRWLGQRYLSVIPDRKAGNAEDWLAAAFDRRDTAALGWTSLKAVNELYGRNPATRDPESLLLLRQIGLAVPVEDTVTHEQYAVVGILRWKPFQDILDRNDMVLRASGLKSGYAYLIDIDSDTIVGHKRRDLLAASLKTLARDNPGLDKFRLAVSDATKTAEQDFTAYDFPPNVAKVAYLTPMGRDPKARFPQPLQWVLGIGANDADLRTAVGVPPEVFFLPSALVAIAAALVYRFWARRYRASFKEAIETIRSARTLDDVTSSVSEAQYNELIDAAGALIVRSREGRVFTPIPNNYVVGRPISDGMMFFGRADELDRIGQQLQEPGNELIILAGQRRVGKTSLLYQIKRRSRGCTCVFVDTQRIVPSVACDGDLYAELYKAIAREVDKPSAIPAIPDRTDDAVARQLNDLMRDLYRRRLRLVLLVDEFENLQDLFEKGKMTDAPLKWLAAHLEGREAFSMVVTGSEGMMKWSAGAVLGARASNRLRLSFLKRNDAEELVRRPLLGFASFADGTVNAILRATGCHPLLTQDFCYRLVSRLNAEHVSIVKSDDVVAVSEDFIQNAPTWIEDAWSRLPEGDRVALRMLAVHLDSADAYATPVDADTLPSYVTEQLPPGFSLQAATNGLLDREWLQKSQAGYRFRSDLHRCWIREYHPLDIVTEAGHGHAKPVPAHESY